MARKKASRPPPPSPRKLRSVIQASMLNTDTIPQMNGNFDSTEWDLFNHLKDLPDILRTVENNFNNPKWELINPAILNGAGWYLWQPTENQQSDYLVWLSAGQVKSDKWDNNMSLMTMMYSPNAFPDSNTKKERKTGEQKYSMDGFIVNQVHQNDDWGHQRDFLYTLILPTDENKKWISIRKIDNIAINWNQFPKVLVEGA